MDVGDRAVERLAVEGGARLDHRGLGDVDAVSAGSLPAGPGEDARVLGLVPEISLKDPQPLEGREVLGEETAFVVQVVAGRDRPADVGEMVAHLGPEAAVSGATRRGARRWRLRSLNHGRRLPPAPRGLAE